MNLEIKRLANKGKMMREKLFKEVVMKRFIEKCVSFLAVTDNVDAVARYLTMYKN